MELNLRLYPRYQALRNLIFWLPVFFLYFERHVSVDRVLLLESIYYVAVLVLEVPSGYLSDRIGRKPTLAIAMLAWCAASVVFATTGSFAAFACGQVLLAAGMAFNSGTDSALLYDSLSQLGRTGEYAARAGSAHAAGLIALAASSFVGGVLAGFALEIAYVLSAIAAGAALVTVSRLEEPTRDGDHALPPFAQMRAVAGRLADPVLAWILAFAVGLFVLSHLPYELIQPWVRLLVGDLEIEGWDATPAATGAVFAGMMLISAASVARAGALQARLGTRWLLLGVLALQVAVVFGLGTVHIVVLPLLLLRAAPQAIAAPVTEAAIHPRLHSGQRATFLSVVSLAGRGTFAVTLAAVGAALGSLESVDEGTLSAVSRVFTVVGVAVFVILLILSGPALRNAGTPENNRSFDRMGKAMRPGEGERNP